MIATLITTPCRDRRPMLQPKTHRDTMSRSMSRFPGAAVLGLIFIKSQTVCPMSLIESLRPFDLSKTLQHLTQAGLLESTGGRGAVYHLPGEPIPTPDDVFGPATRFSVPSSPN